VSRALIDRRGIELGVWLRWIGLRASAPQRSRRPVLEQDRASSFPGQRIDVYRLRRRARGSDGRGHVSLEREATVKKFMLHRIGIIVAVIAVGGAGIATDALARGGGGGHFGGAMGGGHIGRIGENTSAASASISASIEVGERRTDTMATATIMIRRLLRPTSSRPIRPRLTPTGRLSRPTSSRPIRPRLTRT
jgi:hypothetical protein